MADLEQLKASLARRVEKVQNLGDGEDTKRQRKREFAEIGKLRKKIAQAESEIKSSIGSSAKKRACTSLQDETKQSKAQVSKKSKTSENGSSITVECGDTASVGGKAHIDNNPTNLPKKKCTKGVLKSMNNKLSQLSTRKQFKQAHKSFMSLAKRGISGNVHTFSIMINCAVRCGKLDQACAYYEEMKSLGIPPNVITVTTLLKGYCEAGSIDKAKQLLDRECDGGLMPNIRTVNTMLRGCVRTGNADVAISIFNRLVEWKLETDDTCMIAMCGLFCRVLRVEDAHKLASSIRGAAPEAWVDLALSYALLEKWSHCEDALNQAEKALSEAEVENTHSIEKKRMSEASDEFGNKTITSDVRKSVKLFNTHKQAELKKIIDGVRGHCSQVLAQSAGDKVDGGTKKREPYWSTLSRVLPLSFGDASGASEVVSKLLSQFGLDIAVDMTSSIKQQKARLNEVSHRIESSLDPQGYLNWSGVFPARSKTVLSDESERPQVKLEICSGHGEWVVDQALADTSSQWIALELRHDRVFQTVARMYLERVNNLCVIGPNDARQVLEEKMLPGSIDAIFINHPEPPERTGGSDDSEGSHLLNDAFFGTMCEVLKHHGTITIVTDNQPYALSLAKSANIRSDLENAELLERHHCQELSTTVGDIDVYVGKPGSECGHVSNSSSFFDRMWKQGKKHKRYTIFLNKV